METTPILPVVESSELLAPMPDQILVEQAQQGDPRAFNVLFEAHHQRVFRQCREKRLSPDEAADVTQEVFLKVFRSLKSYEHQFRFTTWLYRVTENACIDQLRKRNRRQRRFVPLLTNDQGHEVDIVDSRPDPENNLETAQLRNRIAAAMATLPPCMRDTLELKERLDLSYAEISKHLQCTVGTVKSRLHRARQELLRQLAPAVRSDADSGRPGRRRRLTHRRDSNSPVGPD